jgi:hypothetical protein
MRELTDLVKIKIKCEYTEEALGTVGVSLEAYKTHVLKNAPGAKEAFEELEDHKKTANQNAEGDEIVQDSMTIYNKDDDGIPYVYNYQVRGFLKAALEAYTEFGDYIMKFPETKLVKNVKKKAKKDCATPEEWKESQAMPAKIEKTTFKPYAVTKWQCKKLVDKHIFVYPRRLKLNIPEGKKMGINTRSLRVMTAKGERVALASSETVPVGTWFECIIECRPAFIMKYLGPLLDYGQKKGISQWRNGGSGSFVWELLEGDEPYADDTDA